MPISLTPQAEARVEESLVEDENLQNEYDRAIERLQNSIQSSKDSADEDCELSEFYDGMSQYLLDVIQKYWNILRQTYEYEYLQETNNLGFTSPFQNPEFPTQTLDDSVMISYNFSTADLSVLDVGSPARDYLTNFAATKPQYSNFNEAWYPANVNGVLTTSSRPNKGPYFNHSYYVSKSFYDLKLVTPIPPIPPLYKWADPLDLYGMLAKSAEYLFSPSAPAISPANEATLLADLDAAFSTAQTNLVASIDALIPILTEPEHATKVTNLNNLKTSVQSYTIPSTEYASIISDLDSLLPSIQTNMNYFTDILFYYFRKRSGFGGSLNRAESSLNSIQDDLDEIAELQAIEIFVDIYFDPTP